MRGSMSNKGRGRRGSDEKLGKESEGCGRGVEEGECQLNKRGEGKVAEEEIAVGGAKVEVRGRKVGGCSVSRGGKAFKCECLSVTMRNNLNWKKNNWKETY